MKKLNYLMIILFLTGFIFMSCSTDEDPEEMNPPSISFLGGIHQATGKAYVDGDIILTVGEQMVFGITAKSESNKNLKRIYIERVYEVISTEVIIDSTINSSNFTYEKITATNPNVGMEDFNCTVTDKNDKTTTISFTITTVLVDPGINVYTGISLGSYDSPTNSSFASITGETYSIADAGIDSIQSKIDWVYFDGASWGHTLMSPSDTIVETVYPTIGDWDANNRNQTRFAKTDYTPDDYNFIENDNQLVVMINNANLNFVDDFFSELQSNPGGFAVGDIIAFETHIGLYGFIKVTAVDPGANNGLSTITYDLKVVK
ncbi:MAG: hypothetical protein K8R86_05905 [Bacteroidales bacterium]|nr:hypothetical protein [Bacteroidales bacterium]